MVAYSLHFPHGHTKVHTWKKLVYNWYFITKGKGVQVRLTVETLLPQWWAFQKFQVIESQNVYDQMVNDTRSKVRDYTQCTPFILSGSKEKCWLYICAMRG